MPSSSGYHSPRGKEIQMRTISALIAATICALVFTGPAFARDGDHARAPASNWLASRTAFAAEDLWPKRVTASQPTHVVSPIRASKRAEEIVAAREEHATRVEQGFDFLRDWAIAAKAAQKHEWTSMGIGSN